MKETLKGLWNHGGSMFSTFWIVFALYALGVYLVWAFLQLDAQFSRPLAGDVIPANVTQQIAWGTRAFSVIAGSMAIYFHVKEMPSWRRIFSLMTVVAALILLLHAYGIAAKIMQGQFDADAGIEQVATVNTDAISQQISDLEQERTDLRSDTQITLDTYQRAIDNITSDGLDNDDQAEVYAVKQQEALEARDTRLGEIRSEIAALRAETRSVASTATQEQVESDSFNPLFVFGARLSTWTWDPSVNPSNVHKFAWGVAFFTLFFGFGEILMMVAFTGGYAALKVVSERERRSAAARKGHETRKKNQDPNHTVIPMVEDDGYWESRIQKALKTRMKKRTPEGMANTYFGSLTPPELKGHLRKLLREGFIYDKKNKTPVTQDVIDFILLEGEHAPETEQEAKPEQTLNGAHNADDSQSTGLPATS